MRAGLAAWMLTMALPAAWAADAPWVKVEAAWIRATVKGQSGTGGFMTLTATKDVTLTGFRTDVATDSELHEMVMKDGVMRMRAVSALPLPAGQAVPLRPGMGGHHLMLMGLQRQLKAGEDITLTLMLRTAEGKALAQDIKVPVQDGATAMAPSTATSAPGVGEPHKMMMQGGMHP